MASTAGLQTQVDGLAAALEQIRPLVDRLRDFTTSIGQGDDARLELGGEIHARLKEAEDAMELLKVEIDALELPAEGRRKDSVLRGKEAQRERAAVFASRLDGDLRKMRAEFRNAQLQAKRNAERAKRKERELLLSRPRGVVDLQRQPSDKFTHDDLVLNASSNVTMALRRTHQLMQAELSRSQFAQQTLEQSTAILSSLSESYTGLDSLISSSRNLLGSLLRSQKSDTWYLETAFYILIGTIIWLTFRRILYGPLWWIVWMPVKILTRSVLALLAATGVSSKAIQFVPAGTMPSAPSMVHGTQGPTAEAALTGVSAQNPQIHAKQAEEGRMVDRIATIIN